MLTKEIVLQSHHTESSQLVFCSFLSSCPLSLFLLHSLSTSASSTTCQTCYLLYYWEVSISNWVSNMGISLLLSYLIPFNNLPLTIPILGEKFIFSYLSGTYFFIEILSSFILWYVCVFNTHTNWIQLCVSSYQILLLALIKEQ